MKKAYFISDLHLGAGYLDDKRETECRVVRFLDSIKDDVGELYLLGDILDYWYEYRYVVPRGHVRFLGKLAELADSGVKITWIVGNHDVWLFDYLRDEVGLTVLRGATQMSILGTRFLLSHGDDVGRQAPLYRFTRMCFHSRVCQWLYASIHPRWTVPIATGWSKQNRTTRTIRQVLAESRDCLARLAEFSVEYAAAHPDVRHFVYGHLHVPYHDELAGGRTMTVLGEWISQFTYATWDGHELALRHFEDNNKTTNHLPHN